MTFFLAVALCALVVALVAIWTERVNAACMRNVQEAEGETLKRLQAANERLNRSIAAALSAAERLNEAAQRRTIPLQVKTPKQVDRAPAKKKAPKR